MHLILTHEQADFDAIGALLGAYLMHENAIPVLPRRLNRNVKAFLTLYGAELPFVELNEIPNGPIETVTLVDTQSLVTLRGMNANTAVQVVDHHSMRPDIPPSWTTTIEQTGACTTLFVEGLHERDRGLDLIHATLLLLGIYEDTGSLSYANTTARDARAVSVLLDQGANVQIAVRYLNPALSAEQRLVYDRLLANARVERIHGLQVVVAAAEAFDMTDEISSIAHKIRDLLDPAALFLLVHTSEGIRLVARSTSDQIEVSQIAVHFRGGGHNRAAAALVKVPASGRLEYQKEDETPLQAVRSELERILPDHIRPSATVRQLMSRQPLVLSPDTPAEDALHLMQRYGYEGYPIVRDGKVIGLLNRRAVDRAVSHHMNLTAASLMEAGEVTVSPDDSIDHVSDVMIRSGWGQVPVVDNASGQVVGIVTRTDLLKHITGYAPLPGRHNLVKRLESALPPARLALLKAVAAEARRLHQAVYIVGGFVRDLLLDRPGVDFDLVVEGDAIALGRSLSKRFGGRILAHSRFGTAKWTIETVRARLAGRLSNHSDINPDDLPESLDLISARTEFYDYPTALPSVERSSIKLDLHRRDFTINTMALRLDGHHYGDLYDYWGGLRDLQAGLVRVLHSLSFVDDPTRLLRAVRFEQRFDFKIEERTLQLMAEAHPLIRNLSGDRLRHELTLILSEQKAIAMLNRLKSLELLQAIHPDLTWSEDVATVMEQALFSPIAPEWRFPQDFANLPSRIALAYAIWFSRLPLDKAYQIADRLRLPGTLQAQIVLACQMLHDLPELEEAPVSQIVSRLDNAPTLALYATYLLSPNERHREILENFVTHWQTIQPETNGETLRSLGVPPGPLYKEILGRLRAAWLDGQVMDTAQERGLLKQLLAEHGLENPLEDD